MYFQEIFAQPFANVFFYSGQSQCTSGSVGNNNINGAFTPEGDVYGRVLRGRPQTEGRQISARQ